MRPIQNPLGLQILEGLVDLVKNPKQVEKILKEIHAARDEANAKIAVVGSVEEIERMKSKAAEALAKAERKLADAERKAAEILKTAGNQATAKQETHRRAAAAIAACEKKAAELEAREAKVAAREKEVAKDLDAAREIRAGFESLFTN